MDQQGATVVLRTPHTAPPPNYTPPSMTFLQGKWHVTHSTLPLWKSKRNVTITYKLLEPSDKSIPADQTDRLDDLATYQTLTSDKVMTVHGLNKALDPKRRDAWGWRGRGLLMVASSHWEILGSGYEAAESNQHGDSERGEWLVTFFAKTIVTPAGLDIYSRSKKGLNPITVQRIENELAKVDNDEIKELAKKLFAVKMFGD
ncbi:hypothetical protein CAC42_3947 [Sphaceloma murrayae]|uniref:Uncharacterized protein n=1 Tax=Sphaceloma murrayae TaxID=2082308 RepID=A0A2K1QSC2_9PEZI|nr:hypothetical protein CAC42_3947 [Sphaceloma murrayae]